MVRKRTAWEQAKSGLRIGGAMVLCFFVLLGLAGSILLLTLRNNTDMRGAHPVLGLSALLLLSALLFYTTRIWAKWLLAMLAYCACRLLIGVPALLVFGRMQRADLDTALLMIPALVISTLLTCVS